MAGVSEVKAARLRDIAQRAGVHPSTVSRVLNEDAAARLSAATRERVLEVARELGYRPNRLARSLKLRRANLLGILVPDVTNPFFAHIFRAVEDVAREQGFGVVLGNTDDLPDRAVRHVETLGEGHIDGVLVATARRDDPAIARLERLGLPFVLVNRRRDCASDWWVASDDERGARLVARHLAALGHTRIALLRGPDDVSTAAERLAGFRAGLAEAGLALDERLLAPGGFTEETGYAGMARLLRLPAPCRPTAVFALNDLGAIGALRAARDAGLAVPRELSIVGYNDIPLAALVAPPLTTVHVPLYEMGRRAAELLISRVRKEVPERTQVVLPVQLVPRASTAPPA